jgi:hypothetical protein
MKITKAIKNLFYFNSKAVYNSNMIDKNGHDLIKSSRLRGNRGVNFMSMTAKLARHLSNGNTVTSKEITGKFGLANPHEAIRQLRQQGLCVYANPVTLWDGTPSTKYRIGKPTKAMIAAAYASLGGYAF